MRFDDKYYWPEGLNNFTREFDTKSYKEAKIKCNVYTSPHIQKINERFVYDDQEISDKNLIKLLAEVEDINAGEPITYFEILTAAYFYNARNFKNNTTWFNYCNVIFNRTFT